MSVIFSDFLLLNEMSMCMEKLSTSLFTVHALFMLCYLFKVSRIDVDDPVIFVSSQVSNFLRKSLYNMEITTFGYVVYFLIKGASSDLKR